MELGIIGSMLRADTPIFVPKDTSELSVGMLANRRAERTSRETDHERGDRPFEPSARNVRTPCTDDIACVLRRRGKAKRVGKISTRKTARAACSTLSIRAS